MVGSLTGRITRLEQRHLGGAGFAGTEEAEAKLRRTEKRRAEIRARLQRVIDEEGEEMDPRRQRAIDDLLESMRSRREADG
jgi:hypothetical protein